MTYVNDDTERDITRIDGHRQNLKRFLTFSHCSIHTFKAPVIKSNSKQHAIKLLSPPQKVNTRTSDHTIFKCAFVCYWWPTDQVCPRGSSWSWQELPARSPGLHPWKTDESAKCFLMSQLNANGYNESQRLSTTQRGQGNLLIPQSHQVLMPTACHWKQRRLTLLDLNVTT